MSEHAYQLDHDAPQQMGAEGEFVAPIPRISIQAFCVSEVTARTLQSVADDRRLARAHVTVQMGGIDAAIEFYETAPTPNLILLEVAHGPEAIMADLARLAQVCDAGTKVIVIGQVNDVMLYRELVKQGVSEYLVAPISILQTIQSIGGLYADADTNPLGRVVAFVGAKGGVGSSTIAHNCGWVISKTFGSDVIIADMDLPFGTAALDFNQDPTQGLAEAVYSPDRLDDVLLDRLLTKCDENLSLFAAPATLDRDYDLDPDSYSNVLDLLRKSVPIVVLDMPHMWSGWLKKALLSADDVVIVAEPDLANMRNVKGLVELIKQNRPNDRPPFLVLNKVGVAKRPEIAPADFGDAVDIAPTAVIGFDPQSFGTAANNGQMLPEMAANAKPNEAFLEISKLVTGRSEVRREKRSVLTPFLGKLKRSKN